MKRFTIFLSLATLSSTTAWTTAACNSKNIICAGTRTTALGMGSGESLDEFISASASIDSKFEVMMLMIIPPPVLMKMCSYYEQVLLNVWKLLEEGYHLTPSSHCRNKKLQVEFCIELH